MVAASPPGIAVVAAAVTAVAALQPPSAQPDVDPLHQLAAPPELSSEEILVVNAPLAGELAGAVAVVSQEYELIGQPVVVEGDWM